MPRPHAAAIIEDGWNRQVAGAMRRRGWGTRVLTFTGYGSTDRVRVLGRVVMTRRPYAPAAADARATWLELRTADGERRGWRSFFAAPAGEEPVTVRIADREFRTRSDRSGLIDLTITGHGLEPGWHDVQIVTPRAADTTAAVFVLAPGETFGIVSDIDDTIISTTMPRPMIAAYNTFFATRAPAGPSPAWPRCTASCWPSIPAHRSSTSPRGHGTPCHRSPASCDVPGTRSARCS